MNQAAPLEIPPATAFSIQWNFEKDPRIVELATTIYGRILLIALFAMLYARFALNPAVWIFVVVCIVAASFTKIDRVRILTYATLTALMIVPRWQQKAIVPVIALREHVSVNLAVMNYGELLAFGVFASAFLLGMKRFPHHSVWRFPILTIILTFFALVFLAESKWVAGLPVVLIWGFIEVYRSVIWFFCYAVINRRSKNPDSILAQFSTFNPLSGSTTVPIGKGVSNLRKHEAKNTLHFTSIQLSGMRLLIICFFLNSITQFFTYIAREKFGISTFNDALIAQNEGQPYSIGKCWLSLLYDFILAVLTMAVWGNGIVSCLRMLGFDVLRNNYHAFRATTLADFWNRFYFYFKELLVDFFFFPTFLRCFRRHRRLRVAFATFMAACVGNMLFHFIRDSHNIAFLGWKDALIGFDTYAVYTVILTTGIIVSQLLSERKKNRSEHWAMTMLAIGKVWLFYCLLHIFDDVNPAYTLGEHVAFLTRIFGLDKGFL